MLRRLIGARDARETGLEQRVDALLAELAKAGLQPSVNELADVLWFASQIASAPLPTRPLSAARGSEAKPGSETAAQDPRKGDERPQPEGPGSRLQTDEQSHPVYPRTGGAAGGHSARPVHSPAVTALPNVLAIGRSLRPLHRKVASRTRLRLNEEATAERAAERFTLARLAGAGPGSRQPWASVFENDRERWLDLALVIDQGESMLVWQPLVANLRRLLTYNGAFRTVRTWYLDTDTDRAALRAAAADPRGGRACRPRELFTPGGRRLILVVSDCISRAWHTGSVNDYLRLWGSASPLAVLNMLPQRMWRGSALGRGAETRLLAAGPGAPAVKLREVESVFNTLARQRNAGDLAQVEESWRLPVVSLEPEVLRSWGWLLNGRSNTWIHGVRFDSRTRYTTSPRAAVPVVGDGDGDKRLRRFHANASPLARDLAGYLAAAPLTLPVMRLVQQAMLPQSGQPHLAEVFVSGLLYKRADIRPAGGMPYYDFLPGVRDRLLDPIGASEAEEVLRQVSEFVASRTGSCLDFQALLADPGAVGDLVLDREARYFAIIGASVLRRFGGAYQGLADRLEGIDDGYVGHRPRLNVEEQESRAPEIPTPFHDPFLGGKGNGPEMVWLPGGTFTMGDDIRGRDNEKPAHEVRLDHFAAAKYLVTVGEFRRFVEATGYRTEAETGDGAYVASEGYKKVKDADWRKTYFEQSDAHPVVNISWNDAQEYCRWLTEETGRTYGLLTEARWEYACRAGSETAYCFGDDSEELSRYAWYGEDWKKGSTHSVGNKEPNRWGLFDMHGNVWEWVSDWYSESYYEQLLEVARSGASGTPSSSEPAPSENPGGPQSGSIRVFRGGSWYYDADDCRSAYRNGRLPGGRDISLGFRLSRTGPLSSYPFTLGPRQSELAPEPKEPTPWLRDRLQDGGEGPDMVWLPGGTFTMGQDDSPFDEEKPAHSVCLDTFSVGQYPVTFGKYERFCEATGRKMPDDRGGGRGEMPVINVDWTDAQAYCAWLSKQTGEQYQLLTEAQWEYACRGGNPGKYRFWDNEGQLEAYAWYGRSASGKTHPVGEKRPNDWHLYDMHGNVDEWVSDWYSQSYYEQLAGATRSGASGTPSGASGTASGSGQNPSDSEQAPSENPSGPESGSYRVVRGGSWLGDADDCRSACRNGYDPGGRGSALGFRLSRIGPWSLDALTLGSRRQKPAPEPEREQKPRYQPLQGFRDHLSSGGEAPGMVYLEGGTFRMGDEQGIGQERERPVHLVSLDAFAIGRVPVTVGEYLRFCEVTSTSWPEWLEEGSAYHIESGKYDYYSKRGMSRKALDLPIVGIAWEDAASYCEWVSEQTGERYELLTEAQWEYACRGGSEALYCFGDNEEKLGDYAWYNKNAGSKVQPVGKKQANGFGLHDMHGNVWEWGSDWYSERHYEQLLEAARRVASGASSSSEQNPSGSEQSPSENPSGSETGSARVVRGGSWLSDADHCRSAFRTLRLLGFRSHFLGFRLSRKV